MPSHGRRSGKDANAVNPAVLRTAREMSKLLTKRGYAHALIGGLAVNRHGYPRSTSDVDFLVTGDAEGELAGDSLGGEVRGKMVRMASVNVDLLFPRPGEEFLESAIARAEGSPPVVSKAVLVYLKLSAGRMRDNADVLELLKRGKVDVASTTAYLKNHRRSLVEDFAAMVEQAQIEPD